MEVQLNRNDVFKRVVDAMKDLVSDTTLKFSDSGMSIQSMDSSHVSLCKVHLNTTFFETYVCGDKPTSIGLRLSNLAKVLKCSGKDDSVILKTTSNNSDILTLMFENKSKNKIIDFQMKLMDVDEEELAIPEKGYEYSFTMDTMEFTRIIRDISDLGDTCTISVSSDTVNFSVSGDVGEVEIRVRNITSLIETASEQSEITLTFALGYLKLFTNAAPLSKIVNLSMSTEMPLLVEFLLEENDGKIQYYLAPKIDNDDEF